MSEVIRLVTGDSRPYVYLTLTDRTGAPVDVDAVSTDVVVHFRRVGTTEVLATLQCEKVDAPKGVVRFNFAGNVLDVPPGRYEGEIQIDWDGEQQTVFQLLKFRVRAQVA
jgi:hypothetical protein